MDLTLVLNIFSIVDSKTHRIAKQNNKKLKMKNFITVLEGENITCTSLRPSVLITAPFFFTTIKAGMPVTLYLLFNDLMSQKNGIKWVERKSMNRIYQRYYAANGLPHCTVSQSPCDSTMYDNISCSLLSDETNTTSTGAFWSFKS